MSNIIGKITCTPWSVEPYLTPERDDDPMGVYKVQPAHDKLTKQYFETDPEDDPDFYSVHDENQANAEYIVKCVNNHEKLVSTLKYALSILESIQPEQLEILENDLDELVDFNRIYSLLNELGEEYPPLRVKNED